MRGYRLGLPIKGTQFKETPPRKNPEKTARKGHHRPDNHGDLWKKRSTMEGRKKKSSKRLAGRDLWESDKLKGRLGDLRNVTKFIKTRETKVRLGGNSASPLRKSRGKRRTGLRTKKFQGNCALGRE